MAVENEVDFLMKDTTLSEKSIFFSNFYFLLVRSKFLKAYLPYLDNMKAIVKLIQVDVQTFRFNQNIL